jgi:type I restriction enzyme S subunit
VIISLSISDLPLKGADGVIPARRVTLGELPPDRVTFTGGDILVARNSPHLERGRFGKIHPEFGEEGFAAASEFHVIRVRESVSASYLWHFLRQPGTRDLLGLSVSGPARKRYLPAIMLGGLLIPLPPRSEQERIAELLDEVEAARRLQDEIMDGLGQLPAALFLEIFGEPGANPKNFEKAFLSELLRHVEAGPRLSLAETSLSLLPRLPAGDKDYGVITQRAVASGFFLPHENHRLSGKAEILPGSSLSRGDLLFSTTNQRDRVGNITLLESDFPYRLLSPRVLRLRPHPGIAPSFIKGLFTTEYVRRQIRDKASSLGAVMYKHYRIDRNALLSIHVFRPPASLQRQFDLGYWAVAAARRREEETAAKIESLYASLLFRIFGRWRAQMEVEAAAPPEGTQPQAAAARVRRPFPVPERLIWNKLSRTQQLIWEITHSLNPPFGVEDVSVNIELNEGEANREQVINTLELLVSLGVIIKEGRRDADRWRPPDAEKDLQVAL